VAIDNFQDKATACEIINDAIRNYREHFSK
jgi:hypothetical protein